MEIWIDPEARSKANQVLREQGFIRDFEVALRKKSGEAAECGEAHQAAVDRAELFAGAGLDEAVPRRAGGKVQRCDLVLSERGLTQSAFTDGL